MSSPIKSSGNPHGFTTREMEIIVRLWISAKGGEPQIDWDIFAKNAGYKNSHSASVSVGPIRRRLQALREAQGNGTDEPLSEMKSTPKSSPRKAKSTPRSAKKRAVSEDSSEDEEHKKMKFENVDPLGLDPDGDYIPV